MAVSGSSDSLGQGRENRGWRERRRGEKKGQNLGSANRCDALRSGGRVLLCPHAQRGRITCVCSTALHPALGHEEGRAGQL